MVSLETAARGCWDEILGMMPEATLAVRRAAFRGLLTGRAVRVEDVAIAIGLPAETVRSAVGLVASVGMAETDDGLIIGMDGLTTRRTQHGLILDRVSLWTWCAYDIVGIAAALEADAVGTTHCGFCGKAIDVRIQQGKPETTSAVGWLPDESCANVMEEFCPVARLFCSPGHLSHWRERERPGSGDALDLPALAERGHRVWSQLVD